MVGRPAVSDISIDTGGDVSNLGPKSILDEMPNDITEFLDNERVNKDKQKANKSSKLVL